MPFPLKRELYEKMSKDRKGKKPKNFELFKSLVRTKEWGQNISKAKKGKLPKCWHRSLCFKKGKDHPHWQGGKSFKSYTTDWTETLRKSIRQRDKYTCQICRKEPAIYCHHIDYNKKNCNPNNLITLCKNCHSKTNTNRNHWINYFNIQKAVKYKTLNSASLFQTIKVEGIGEVPIIGEVDSFTRKVHYYQENKVFTCFNPQTSPEAPFC